MSQFEATCVRPVYAPENQTERVKPWSFLSGANLFLVGQRASQSCSFTIRNHFDLLRTKGPLPHASLSTFFPTKLSFLRVHVIFCGERYLIGFRSVLYHLSAISPPVAFLLSASYTSIIVDMSASPSPLLVLFLAVREWPDVYCPSIWSLSVSRSWHKNPCFRPLHGYWHWIKCSCSVEWLKLLQAFQPVGTMPGLVMILWGGSQCRSKIFSSI